MKITTLAIATRNSGKLREFRSLLASTGWRVAGLEELAIEADYEETGATFAENARLKARSYSGHTELPVLGDDSGLEVCALGGRPGVYSARYAGAGATDGERIRMLLAELDRNEAAREARFVCALALAHRGKVLLEVAGECRGVIAREPRGSRGFGYDPIFYFPELGRTYAELEPAEKDRVSHRARAASLLLEKLDELTGE